MASAKPILWADPTHGDAIAFWLYCIAERGCEENGPCKIGIATNFAKRLASLQGGNWRKLNTIWYVRVASRVKAKDVEQYCLGLFRPSDYLLTDRIRLQSEWVQAKPMKVLERALILLNAESNAYRQVA